MTLTVIDGGDQSASHVFVFDSGVPAATARLTIMATWGPSSGPQDMRR